ncbi:hypothetical protein B0H14DRAFT_3867439 [Mycena olivaceomarginata]|nr:hypothetical protein B0H14DRAFT_3867439 [Mycena olivaceomarginata]
MLPSLGALLRQALTLFVLSSTVYAQKATAYDPAPFNYIGTISSMTLNGTAGPLAGGTLTVNGFKITIPKNTLVTLPSITVAWSELFVNGQPNLPLLGSVSWEATCPDVTIQPPGFRQHCFGPAHRRLVYISQEATQSLTGFITSINLTTGHFFVDNVVECVLNDPLGRYGHAYTANPLWSVDPDNPSVRASTGFPVCIPRNSTDHECPLTNRPLDTQGNYLSTFTYPDPARVVAGGLDPRIMAPLAVGDYIIFSGIKTPEGVLALYSLEANLGIRTAPGTKPAYLTVESANYGIIDPNPNLETGETRAVAFATDATTTVEWFAIDVDPCTGEESERQLVIAQGSGVAPVGKIVYRLGKVDASPATREVGFRYTSGNFPWIVAGQFIQPIFEFIFPELITFGANEVPNQFDVIPFLALGSGPLEFGNNLAAPLPSPTIVGQLSPWPGNPVPAATSCPPPSAVTSTTRTTTPSSTPSSPPPVKDIITIVSATSKNQKGQTTTTVVASSNNPAAQLFMAITGVDNVSPQAMTKLANGQFTLAISTKGKPSSVTITSSLGGTPVTAAV